MFACVVLKGQTFKGQMPLITIPINIFVVKGFT